MCQCVFCVTHLSRGWTPLQCQCAFATDLDQLPAGVGPSWVEKVNVLLRGERLPIMVRHLEQFRVHQELMKVHGIGARSAMELYEQVRGGWVGGSVR